MEGTGSGISQEGRKQKKQKIEVTKHCLKFCNPAKRREPTKKGANRGKRVCKARRLASPPLSFSHLFSAFSVYKLFTAKAHNPAGI